MRNRIGLLLATLTAVAAMTTAAEPPAPMLVQHAEVRLNRSGSRDGLVFDAKFPRFPLLVAGAFDPATDEIELAIGATDTIRVGPGDRVAHRGRGRWIRYRTRNLRIGGADRVRSFLVDFEFGRVRARVLSAGAFGLRSASNLNVPVTLRLGTREFASPVDFGMTPDGRTWRGPKTVPWPPDGSWVESRINDGRTVAIRDAAAWTALWREHTGDAAATPEPVDFSTEMVVAVFRGGTGVALKIDGETGRNSERVVVRFSMYEAGGLCGYPMAHYSYGSFERMPRTDLPVVFEEVRRIYDCRFQPARVPGVRALADDGIQGLE